MSGPAGTPTVDLAGYTGSLDGGYTDATVYLRVRLADDLPTTGQTYALLGYVTREDGSLDHIRQVRLIDGVWSVSPSDWPVTITGPASPEPGSTVVLAATIPGPIRTDRGLWIGRVTVADSALPATIERAMVYAGQLHDAELQADVVSWLIDPEPGPEPPPVPGSVVPDLAEAAREIAAELAALGLSTATDERNVNAPGVLVTLDRFRLNRLGAGPVEVDWVLHLVTGDVGRHDATAQLSALANVVGSVWRPSGDVEAVTLTLPSGGNLPSLRFPVRTTVT